MQQASMHRLDTNYEFHLVFDQAERFSHQCLINCLASDLLLCPFHKKLIICEILKGK